jgi:hypothetical protein
MSFELILIFGLILLAMILFALKSVPFDLVAMILMSTLMLSGILDVKEGLSGFSNPATVTIAAMFALSRGIEKTGALASDHHGIYCDHLSLHQQYGCRGHLHPRSHDRCRPHGGKSF